MISWCDGGDDDDDDADDDNSTHEVADTVYLRWKQHEQLQFWWI